MRSQSSRCGRRTLREDRGMKRRGFLALCGGAVTNWPLMARAQQTMPVLGWLSSLSLAETKHHLAAFREGLTAGGYVEGQNLAFEYRFADGDYRRLPALAADLSGRPMALIAALAPPAALAAKAATSTIPI